MPRDAVWLDLLRPEPEEIAFVKRTTGLDVPNVAELSEIESSSRLRNAAGALYLSMPLTTHSPDSDQPLSTPVLVEALSLYRSTGWVEVPAFNDEPFADHWLEKTLT